MEKLVLILDVMTAVLKSLKLSLKNDLKNY